MADLKKITSAVASSLVELQSSGSTNPTQTAIYILAFLLYSKSFPANHTSILEFLDNCGADIDCSDSQIQKLIDVFGSAIPANADVSILGQVYETYILQRRESGSYYTPRYIADFIVQETIGVFTKGKSADELRKIKIIDPAAGAGAFLLSAFSCLSVVFEEKGSTSAFLDSCQCLYGLEIDPIAALVCRLSIWIATQCRVSFAEINKNIRCMDALLGDWGGSYDFIIGNPPYLFGENLPKSVTTNKHSFKFAKGQFDAYWLFYELALTKYLKEDGYHGYIVPDAVLARDSTACIRKSITKRYSLIKIVQAGKVFDGAKVSGAVVVWKKSPQNLETVKIETGKFENSHYSKLIEIEQDLIAALPECRWLVGVSKDELLKIVKLLYNATPLGDLVDISRGEELGKKDLCREPSPHNLPILTGADIISLGKSTPCRYVKKESAKKNVCKYASPKIVLAKTGRDLKASVDMENTLTLQSVYNLTKIKCDIWFLCGYLCSAAINSVVCTLFTDNKKIFPQLNQSTVASIPVYLPKESEAESYKIFKQISSTAKKVYSAPQEQRNFLKIQIDKLVNQYLSSVLK